MYRLGLQALPFSKPALVLVFQSQFNRSFPLETVSLSIQSNRTAPQAIKMKFSVVALFAVLASVATAEYSPPSPASKISLLTTSRPGCPCQERKAKQLGYASPTGASTMPVASTGVIAAHTPTGSPMNYATGAAAVYGVPALGMLAAGAGLALVSCSAWILLSCSHYTSFCKHPGLVRLGRHEHGRSNSGF